MPAGGNGINLSSPLYVYIFKLFTYMYLSHLYIYTQVVNY